MKGIFTNYQGKHLAKPARRWKRALSITLAAALAVAVAAPIAAAALTPNTPKEEVVYVNLNDDGTVEEITVVNIFELNEDGQIIDYGDYTALRNMTTNDTIVFEDETVRIDTNAGKLYYEGTLSKNTIPWDFFIHYSLDGQEQEAAALPGKSGTLEISMAIRKNEDCDSTFFDNYGLQVTFLLDTERCANITAADATAANVGKDRQLTYTILPKTEKDIVITADVTDFEMDGIAINGLPLNMAIDIDTGNNAELNDALGDLEGAVADLDNGAGKLDDGAGELKDGAAELKNGVVQLNDGTGGLYDGVAKVWNGVSSLKDGAAKLDDGVEGLQTAAAALDAGADNLLAGLQGTQENPGLLAGASALKGGAKELSGGLAASAAGAQKLYSSLGGEDVEASQSLYTGAKNLSGSLYTLSQKSSTLTDGAYATFVQLTTQASAQLGGVLPESLTPENYSEVLKGLPESDAVNTVKAQLDSYSAFYSGLKQYTAGVDAASGGAYQLRLGLSDFSGGMETLCDGLTELQTGSEALETGAGGLYDGAAALQTGVESLKGGTTILVKGTDEMKAGSEGLLGGMIELEKGTISLYDGAVELKDGTAQLLDGAITLYDGTVELKDGTVELKDGTFEFRDKTANLDRDLKDKISDAIREMLGGDFDVVSFASEKNTNVEAVQFVIKTAGVRAATTETLDVTETETPTFWQKLAGLF